MDQIVACLERVRDHVYERNVGGLAVEAGLNLFDLGREVEDDRDPTDGAGGTWPTVVRAGEAP